MNEAIKRKWIKFMEGKRKARGQLRSNAGGYCCLGHLCELYRQETGRGAWVRRDRRWIFCVEREQDDATLPLAVAEWAGLAGISPLTSDGEALAILNDTQPGYPIKAIEKL